MNNGRRAFANGSAGARLQELILNPMKTCMLIGVFVFSLVATAAKGADWKDLRRGCEKQVVLEAVGAPLMINKSKTGRQETWTYDCGGYIIFENGRVSYWQPSRALLRKQRRVG